MKKQLAATFLVMSLALPAAAQGFDDTSFDSYRPDLARGERLFEVGACASCHLEKGATLDPAAPVLGGGMEIDSPTFGTIRVPNITGSSAGIGDWSRGDFLNAMLHGTSPEGGQYMPLFPYEFYAKMKPEHVVDLFEYIKQSAPKSDRASEPHSILLTRRLFGKTPWRFSFEPAAYDGQGDSESDAVAWGKYLTEGVAACGACHTPRNSAFILEDTQANTGGISPLGEVAGDITKAALSPLGPDGFHDIIARGTGLDGQTPVQGTMARVSAMLGQADESDRIAIYQYLADLKDLPKPVVEMTCDAPQSPVSDASPELTSAVDDFFARQCKSCHVRGASAASKAVLASASRVASDTSLVSPGDPSTSALYRSLSTMPPGNATSDSDRKLVEDWIAGLAVDKSFLTAEKIDPPRDGSRMHMTFEAENRAVQQHLVAQDDNDRPFMRYFTFRHLQNGQLPCQSMDDFFEQHMNGYLAGLNKLVNSLSWEPKVTKVEPIADGMGVYAIDIRDYGWTHQQWEALIAGQIPGLEEALPYPYGLDPFGAERDENLTQIAQITGTSVPIMRGDWFVANAGEPFAYKFMLNLPDTVQEFESHLLRVDRIGDIQRRDVMRAGFLEGGSGVSQNNRLIERLVQPTGGYYWVSYDFDRAVASEKRLKQSPLGPREAFPPTQHVFDGDGGEMIFTLPNGMQGYYLTDGPGHFIPDGPTSVVFFKGESPVSGATISNGSACMTCHLNGPIEGYDQIRDAVEAQGIDRVTLEIVRDIYAEDDALREAYAEDTNRYLDALAKSGGDYTIPEGPGRYHHEPVTNTIAKYFDELDKDLLAAEFGLTFDELQDRAKTLPFSAAKDRLHAWFADIEGRGLVERYEVEESFQIVAAALYLTTPRPQVGHAVPQTASYQPTHVAAAPVVTHVPTPAPAVQHAPAPRTIAAQPGAAAPQRHGLTVRVENPHLKVCEGARFTVQTDRACLLDVIYPDTRAGTFFRLSEAAIGAPILMPGEVRQIPQPGRELQSHTPSSGVDIAINCYPGFGSYAELGTDLLKTLEQYNATQGRTKNFSEIVSNVTEQTFEQRQSPTVTDDDPLAPVTATVRFSITEDRTRLDANGQCK
ncbi:c-type cytochrome [Pseudooceanicola onchidii]|uniref:c-type cytochrome n=1 Tax=Pseudooceanicola onchidii TaxID=2562279 RepID=UPI0010AAEF67|nr:cytochrome c [Pseudooceanicola onchidii]